MKSFWSLLVLLGGIATGSGAEPEFPRFRVQEIDRSLGIGYAVLLVDVNQDQKTDIVVVDTNRVIWFENPSWKLRPIIQGQTKPDNVCIAAQDIDGDGQVDFALGADWGGLNPKREGTLQWLRRGKSLDERWSVIPIGAEPTMHRIRFADLDGDGKPELVAGPLLGRTATAKNNYMESPVRMLVYKIPTDPVRDRWPMEVIDESLHVVHNFWPIPAEHGNGMDVLCASYEGVNLLRRDVSGKWTKQHLGVGNQATPKKNRGASEIKLGRLRDGKYIATIEPFHGHEVVVYTPPTSGPALWDRHVLDDKLRWGHAVWCADLNQDGLEELIIGVRDNLSDQPQERRGIRLYRPLDAKGTKWARQILEDGGVAVEDLAAGDLNGDGRPDLVAVGRATRNVRIYWNEGTP